MRPPFDSWIAKSLTASLSADRTSFRSRVNSQLSRSSMVLRVFTWSPASRPLTRKTTRPSSIACWRWILQVTVNVSAVEFLRLVSLGGNSLATCKIMKISGEEASMRNVNLGNSANSANSTNFVILIAMREDVQRNLNWSLSIFRALIRVSRVDGGIPSFAAAPDGPETLPLVAANAASIIFRSLSGSTSSWTI